MFALRTGPPIWPDTTGQFYQAGGVIPAESLLGFFRIISYSYFAPASFKSHETKSSSNSPTSPSPSWSLGAQNDFPRCWAPSLGGNPWEIPAPLLQVDTTDEGLSCVLQHCCAEVRGNSHMIYKAEPVLDQWSLLHQTPEATWRLAQRWWNAQCG